MGNDEDLAVGDRPDSPADAAEPRPEEEGCLHSLAVLACSIGFLVVLLGGLGYLLYRAATIEEKVPSEWYWAVAIGSSVLGAPLFLSDEKNPRSVRGLGRHLTQLVGVAAIVAALVAVGLLLTSGLRMLTGVEWAGILLVAFVVNVAEMRHRRRGMGRTRT